MAFQWPALFHDSRVELVQALTLSAGLRHERGALLVGEGIGTHESAMPLAVSLGNDGWRIRSVQNQWTRYNADVKKILASKPGKKK